MRLFYSIHRTNRKEEANSTPLQLFHPFHKHLAITGQSLQGAHLWEETVDSSKGPMVSKQVPKH